MTRSLWVGAGLLLAASPLAAQMRGTIDAGVTDGGVSGFAVSSWFKRLTGPLTFELTGDVQGQHGLGRTDAIQALAGGRLHLLQQRSGLWVGASAGGNHLGGVRRVAAGAWHAIGPFTVQVQGWQTRNRYSLLAGGGDTLPTFPDTLSPEPEEPTTRREQVRSTTDLGLWTQWGRGRLELNAASGVRLATIRGTPGASPAARNGRNVSSTWWSLEGTWWMMDRLGIVTTFGRSPIDPALGASGEQFFRLGFRASLHLRQPSPAVIAPLRLSSGAFRTRQVADEVEFSLLAPAAARVEMMAEFTGWEPVEMERAQGRWRVRLPVPPGMYRVNVRYDGGAWQAPPDTRVIHDEFGQESGELVL
jgi:hypothetical protein